MKYGILKGMLDKNVHVVRKVREMFDGILVECSDDGALFVLPDNTARYVAMSDINEVSTIAAE